MWFKIVFQLLIIGTLIIYSRCANISAPGGGPRDTLRPTIVKSFPKYNQTNFKSSLLIIEVSEPVDISQLKKELLILPPLEEEPILESDRKKITVKLTKPLKENTTYNLYLRKGIKDKTEGNVLLDQRIRFSTGNFLDSASLTGKIINPLTASPVNNALIGLYPFSDTIDILKSKPSYFYYSDKEGNYKINDIKPNKYRIIAFNDINNNLIKNSNESYSFSLNPLPIDSTKQSEILYISYANPDSIKVYSSKAKDRAHEIKLNKSPRSLKITSTPQVKYLWNSSIIKIFPLEGKDSLDITLKIEDSLSNKYTICTKAFFNERGVKNRSILKLKSINKKIANTGGTIIIGSEIPISKVVKDSLKIKVDGRPWTRVKYNINFNGDSLMIQYPEFKDSLKIDIVKDFCISVLGDSSNAIKETFISFKEEEIGLIAGSIKTKYKNYIFEVLSKEHIVLYRFINPKTYLIPNLLPGEYRIRVIEDLNSNQQWDVANLKTNQLAEPIYHHPNIITLKANWELRDVNINTD